MTDLDVFARGLEDAGFVVYSVQTVLCPESRNLSSYFSSEARAIF